MEEPRPLEPIPTPTGQRWRELRLIYLPRVMFAFAVLVVAALWTQTVGPHTLIAEAKGKKIDVHSRQAGMLVSLRVTKHQAVRAGEVIGQIAVSPAESPTGGSSAATPNLKPILAPIDGVVTHLHRRAGEPIAEGEIVVRIESAHPDRLEGFLRQPLPFEPRPGMVVEIHTRSVPRQTAVTTISRVGEELEPIPDSLLGVMHVSAAAAQEPALPVYFELPASLHVWTGENVEVLIH
jgi:hypothetical protein